MMLGQLRRTSKKQRMARAHYQPVVVGRFRTAGDGSDVRRQVKAAAMETTAKRSSISKQTRPFSVGIS